MRRSLAVTLALLLVVTLTAGGLAGCKKKTEQAKPGDAETVVTTQSSDVATESSTVVTTSSTNPPPVPPDAPPTTMVVRLYFGYEDRVMAVERTVPYSQATAKTAMLELLKGPSATELKGLALHSEIPKGTTLKSISVANGIAKVDLSDTFDDGGGTLSVTMRLAQVVYTLTQYGTINSVEFYMGGKKVNVFSGEGVILDHPQKPADYYDLIPVDA
ncbi:MAG: GerMN domain-containing protein [Actinomycetota bacterium]|nr:MAG: Spore germination protein-like [Actinomycetota bacterium]MDO8950585.1 GerMN domain-containing protein [Actinomycetota bacterium]MDP3629556.1 GerMN domain-containing protein [Actinomycetota bacterium]